MYNSYRYVASLMIVEAHETELTTAGIAGTNWSTMVSSRLVGSTSETNVYCGTAHGGCVIWAIPGTPRFAPTRVARCVQSSMVRLTFPKLRRTRIGRGLGLGYTLQPYRPSRSTNATWDRGIGVDESLGQTIIHRISVLRTIRWCSSTMWRSAKRTRRIITNRPWFALRMVVIRYVRQISRAVDWAKTGFAIG